MANDDKKKGLPSRLISSLNSLRRQMNGVYKDTYSTEPENKEELERIGSDIETNISSILTRNSNDNLANISNLYAVAQLRRAVNDKEYNESILNYFEDKSVTDQLVNSYLENKWIIELDREIDVVCKYMPKLTEALNTIKDSVLTADNFDKEYLSFSSPNIGPDDASRFSEEMEVCKKQYDLYTRVDRWYDNTSKYGEQFVYKVPYKKALSRLLNRRQETQFSGLDNYAGFREATLITESGGISRDFADDAEMCSMFNDGKAAVDGSIKLEICKDSLLQSAVDESAKIREMISIAESTSIMESKMSDKVVDGSIFEMPRGKGRSKESTSQEGIVGVHKKISPNDIKVPGLLLKDLRRENVVMLYMDSICLGYYYLEFLDKDGVGIYSDSIFQRKSMGSVGYSAGVKFEDQQKQQTAVDNLLRYMSSAIVRNLDDKFINNNPYLRQEIYSVLKYNDIFNGKGVNTIRVTYLSPSDVEHIKFKEDPDTHRGISDLAAGLIPAKMWCCLNIANTIGILTRGQDKRVYYVKQNVEQNIAQTLLNVINQIKKQNFNIMQIENMNSILGITGKYNDYIIPVGPSGDPPIQMEVMQGQEIDPQTELMDKLEETAVNTTGAPIELVVARLSLDFATQLTMSNTKFLRFIFKRQSKFEQHLSNIMTDIYNTEYEPESRIMVKEVLPSPIMLNVNNLNQIIDLVNSQAQQLAQLEYPDNNEEDIDTKRAIFIQLYVRQKMGNYLKQNEIDLIKAKADIQYQKNKRSEDQQ